MREHQEREFPLRIGSLIRTEEGILFSRCSPGSIPISTDPEVEYNDILDAYGDALDEAARLRNIESALRILMERIRHDASYTHSREYAEALAALSSHSEVSGIREPVRRFAGLMEAALRENEQKTHWSECSFDYLFEQLHRNANKIKCSVDGLRRAVNVGNFAMMLADVIRDQLEEDNR